MISRLFALTSAKSDRKTKNSPFSGFLARHELSCRRNRFAIAKARCVFHGVKLVLRPEFTPLKRILLGEAKNAAIQARQHIRPLPSLLTTP